MTVTPKTRKQATYAAVILQAMVPCGAPPKMFHCIETIVNFNAANDKAALRRAIRIGEGMSSYLGKGPRPNDGEPILEFLGVVDLIALMDAASEDIFDCLEGNVRYREVYFDVRRRRDLRKWRKRSRRMQEVELPRILKAFAAGA